MSKTCECKTFSPKKKARCYDTCQTKIQITNTECKAHMQICLDKLMEIWDKVYETSNPSVEAEQEFNRLEQLLIKIERTREQVIAEAWAGFHAHYPSEAQTSPDEDKEWKRFRMSVTSDKEMEVENKIRKVSKEKWGSDGELLLLLQ